jgi:hypothetical protein
MVYNQTILLIADAANEDVQRNQQDPDIEMGDSVLHKIGITIPLEVSIDGPFLPFNLGGSLCPVCQSGGRQA